MQRIGIVTALMAEAVPVIDFYHLQKQTKLPGYHYFSSKQIDLIVCGLSATKMHAGLSTFFQTQQPPFPQRWLNIGIAGARSLPIGSLVWAGSIGGVKIDIPESATNQTAMNVTSLSKPSTEYKENNLFDMEAQAYLKCIQENLTDFENTKVFCAKVVSDNAQLNTLKMDKHWVTDLIRQNIDALVKEIIKLVKT